MERIEEKVLVPALVRKKEYKEEVVLPLEALEDLDMPVYEMLKVREIPRRWKIC